MGHFVPEMRGANRTSGGNAVKPENYTCENLHQAIRLGMIPRDAARVGLLSDDVETSIIYTCPLCRSSVCYPVPDVALLPVLGLEAES